MFEAPIYCTYTHTYEEWEKQMAKVNIKTPKNTEEILKGIYNRGVHEDKEKNNNVNHPSHYTWLKDKCGIEVLDITRHMDFDLGNAIKYILRAGKKNPEKTIEDLQKAIFYINDKIESLKNGNN